MYLFRLSNSEYAEDLKGRSGSITNNHWNNQGDLCIYMYPNPAAALLELRIYRSIRKISREMVMVQYYVPDESLERIGDLDPKWYREITLPDARAFGSKQLRTKKSLVLAYHSIYLNHQVTYVINPLHPLMEKVSILSIFKPLVIL